ncbi:putative bifunctional diguanylate cyclase/phosphodiesterase [Nocardioides sp. Kera G14]|uniref:putative bifunctional diguanylate cyclase/phosphodiesterase n=1 Tax=Nocardioides sp. Kera G14 TaxID=2884264 RepID=UPI001D120199|nr:GGDEF domain-containing phosphodiesterase [Nocardioides sp. Kera G14]UDY23641.1 EAL domain-containing protein [Nocardioides sp. Kera G14]
MVQDLFDALIQATGEAVWDLDVASGHLAWYNSAYSSTLGIDELMSSTDTDLWARRLHPEDRDRVVTSLDEACVGTSTSWAEEYRLQRDDGTYAVVADRATVLMGQDGRPVRMVGTIRDVSEERAVEERLRHAASHDALTGLSNRTLFYSEIEVAITAAAQDGRQVAVLHLDLDRFKIVNDGFGHPYGDQVLQSVAARLRALVCADDVVARLGGDEFVILVPFVSSASDIEEMAQRLVDSFTEPFVVEGRRIHLTGSIGVALYPEHGNTGPALIDNADVAMYYAKAAGRSAFRSFTPQMAEETQLRIEIETLLRGAAEAGELSLAYQPKLDLRSDRVIGCEALLRWDSPQLGRIGPVDFIPIAEDSGLIVPIGEWVLEEACRQGRAWLDAGLPELTMAVNVSAAQLLQPDPLAWVSSTLERTGFPAELLELELTETELAQDIETTIAVVGEIRKLGVTVSIDDFGTGYSSLDYLRRFDITALKIDRSFINGMLHEAGDAAIVRAAVAVGHALGLRVVAEGVETAEELELLRLLQCDHVQGYLIGHPVPADAFVAALVGAR